jgi:alpha-mannosidase
VSVSELSGDAMGNGEIVLVPHTHWDREWYEPFQVFRLRLVDVLDDVIARAETDPDFRFTIDGQMAAVDDYLEIRPENRDRVAALVERGQLAVGPWQILLDEFLCSGETIVRNLEMGWRRAAKLGGAMAVGYLPDMFGHCAQMPQILARAGIAHACLWRGVPVSVDGHAFRWVAPDGSAVRVEYLWDGYGNALDLFADPAGVAAAALAYRDNNSHRYGDDPVLGMLGSDHTSPRADLMPLAREAGLTVATLAEYLARMPTGDGLPVVDGEMRSHARGNILPGVLSVRVGLKQAMAAAERIAGTAEALAAHWSDESFARYRELAWRRIIECTAHDSVTGCGVDETADVVEARLGEAIQMGRAVRDAVLRSLADAVPSDATLVVNPSAWPRTMLAELDVPVRDGVAITAAVLPNGNALAIQELGRSETLLAEEKLAAAEFELLLRRIHGRELFGQQIERYTVEPGTVTFELAQTPSTPTFDLAALRADLEAAAAAHSGTWTVRTLAQQRCRVLVAVPVPASGHTAVRVSDEHDVPRLARPVIAQGAALDNGQVRVEVADDGTLTVRGADGTVLTGVGRLVDGGDRGDSYNYGPPARDTVVDMPASVRTEAVERGPLRATMRVVREYDWPARLGDDRDKRSPETVRVPVTTLVSLCAGEPFVRLDVSFVNPAEDHRLRLHVPLPAPASTSAAAGQFAVTTRGTPGGAAAKRDQRPGAAAEQGRLAAKGGWGEFPLPTYPASSFVSAGDATVLLDHVTEYELVRGGSELALTLLRAVGWLSVNVHPLRDEPAGPQLPVPGAQYVGREVNTRLAVLPASGGWVSAEAPRLAEQFGNGALVRHGSGPAGGHIPEAAEGVAVAGSGVTVSSVRPSDDGIELRLVAMSDAPTTAVVRGPFGSARRTDLLGRELEDVPVNAGELTVDLAPWEIATLRFYQA